MLWLAQWTRDLNPVNRGVPTTLITSQIRRIRLAWPPSNGEMIPNDRKSVYSDTRFDAEMIELVSTSLADDEVNYSMWTDVCLVLLVIIDKSMYQFDLAVGDDRVCTPIGWVVLLDLAVGYFYHLWWLFIRFSTPDMAILHQNGVISTWYGRSVTNSTLTINRFS